MTTENRRELSDADVQRVADAVADSRPPGRTLTDGDVRALADELEGRLVRRFYINVGKGVWALVWKAIIGAIVIVSAYGALKGMK